MGKGTSFNSDVIYQIAKFDQGFSLCFGHFSKTPAYCWIRRHFMNYLFETWRSPRPVKNHSNSIRYSSLLRLRRLKTILEIEERPYFSRVINNPVIYRFFKDFTNYRKETTRAVVSYKPFPNILKYRDHLWNLS